MSKNNCARLIGLPFSIPFRSLSLILSVGCHLSSPLPANNYSPAVRCRVSILLAREVLEMRDVGVKELKAK